MNVSLSFTNCDEIVDLAKAIIDKYPEDIHIPVSGLLGVRPRPPRATCDDELTLSELALYAAGQLQAYYLLVDSGKISMRQVSQIMEYDVEQLASIKSAWKIGGIVAQRDAFYDMVMAYASSKMEADRADT